MCEMNEIYRQTFGINFEQKDVYTNTYIIEPTIKPIDIYKPTWQNTYEVGTPPLQINPLFGPTP